MPTPAVAWKMFSCQLWGFKNSVEEGMQMWWGEIATELKLERGV